MSSLQYNGVRLEVIHTINFSKRPQMSSDGSTYLYTRYDLEVQCVYNPACTSYHAPTDAVGGIQFPGDGAIASQPGKMAGTTEASLQHKLSQPRGILIYSVSDAILLMSPLAANSVDAANGPFVEECRVQAMHGERTFLVHLKFVTYLKLCSGTDPLICHRWKRYVEIDTDYFTQVITEGEATFRTDMLERMGRWPDQYRNQLFHPIPRGFRREQITVIPNEAGTAVSYRYVDRELPLTYHGGTTGLTRIEAYMTGSWQQTGERTANAMARASLHGMAFSMLQGPTSGGGIPVLASIVSTGMTIGAMRVPKYSYHFLVRVWGGNSATRGKLTTLALAVIAAKIPTRMLYQNELVITHDLAGKFVEVQKTVSLGIEKIVTGGNWLLDAWGAIGGPSILSDADMASGEGALIQLFRDGAEGTGPFIAVNNYNAVMEPPPNSRGTRGSWVGKIVAQVLAGACDLPRLPPVEENNVDGPVRVI